MVEKFKAGDLEQVIQKAHDAGKTPVILNSEIIESFYVYRNVQLIEAKKFLLEQKLRGVSEDEQKDSIKEKIMTAMSSGSHAAICFGNTAVTFAKTYLSDDKVPASIFDWNARKEAWKVVSDGLEADDMPKEAAKKMDGYALVVLSQFKEGEYEEYLKDENLPLDKCMFFEAEGPH